MRKGSLSGVTRTTLTEPIPLQIEWYHAISDVRSAINERYIRNANREMGGDVAVGEKSIVSAVESLYSVLINYEAAMIKTDIDIYYNGIFKPKIEKLAEKELGEQEWKKYARESILLFQYMIKILGKYDLLFYRTSSTGYTNVEILPYKNKNKKIKKRGLI